MALNLKKFTTAVGKLATAGQKVNQTAHDLGVEALTHAAESGDARPVDMVYKAMTAGRLRAEGFAVWVSTFSPIYWDADGLVKVHKKDAKAFHEYTVEKAKANPFWTLEAARERTVAQLSTTALRALIKRYVERVSKADENGIIRNDDGEIVAKIEGNVVDMQSFANRVAKAVEGMADTLPTAAPVSTLIPAAIVEPEANAA